jgi:hypothetical protein
VSAREELFALSGEAEGGRTPLLAAESGEPEPAGSAGLPVLWPQDMKTSMMAAEERMNKFFINPIFRKLINYDSSGFQRVDINWHEFLTIQGKECI